jgi:hypothetical protein
MDGRSRAPARRVGRRAVLRAAALGTLAAAAGCAAPFAGVALRIATGSRQGVYFALGSALAVAWHEELDLAVPPEVIGTAGSADNLDLLAAGAADVVFSQVDVAAERLSRVPADDPGALRALARVYDDVLHLVVPVGSPITGVADLRGRRVSVGQDGSGVIVVSERVLEAAGLAFADLRAERLGLVDSVEAVAQGRIDAFFWSGGLPTQGVAGLAERTPIRLVDLDEGGVLTALRARYPVYAPGTVPARSYAGLAEPVTTLLGRNFLLVRADMSDDLAAGLVEVLFREREGLADVAASALTIDLRAAIGTQPVALHPGALRYYREERG